MAKKSDIGNDASEKTKKIFADELSSLTILTSKEIQSLFPEETDRAELEAFMKIISADSEDKVKQQKLVDSIGKISGAILKIGKKFIGVV